MLKISIPSFEMFNNDTSEFIAVKGQTLQLEHSLVSLSKWESKWCKPFLSNDEKTFEETIDYIRCMTLTQNVNFDILHGITVDNDNQIKEYINAPMTATTFSNLKKTLNKEIVTAEILYYWMIMFNIPFECQKWHLNRLITLINVCNIKNQPAKKMSRRELMNRNKELNASRKKQLNTKG